MTLLEGVNPVAVNKYVNINISIYPSYQYLILLIAKW